MFRGREMVHPEIGRALLEQVAEKLKEVSVIEKPAEHGRALPLHDPRAGHAKRHQKEMAAAAAGRRRASNAKAEDTQGRQAALSHHGTGKVMHRKGHISHLRPQVAKRAKRQISDKMMASAPMQKRVHRLLPYG